MLQIQFVLHNLFLVNLLAMGSRLLLPPSNRSLIQLKRMNNGLERASIGKQGHDDHNQFDWLAQPLEHGPFFGAERFTADLAFVPLSLLAMLDDVPCADLPSCGTPFILAE